jgi:hypothetical protein
VRYATSALNTPQSWTDDMTFQLLFGRLPNLSGIVQREPKSTYRTYDNSVKELEARMQSSYAW